ncbi:signal peptidase I [Denitrovibrio acetiphilus DSM 12809]|uniref:Signal peptidase I n=1 Tax=Denitrovibrio acetiphilus (strain DSM 12809 / NBRC 114555 / N2460) TaxID=522772 RepID=D4H3Y1_DENA2|nr:signal peptidase I [Denitrovibrio acetiphilus]ADD67292.1 signal peptidase I [Denitrovibrio acetiphilus DSM 12809]
MEDANEQVKTEKKKDGFFDSLVVAVVIAMIIKGLLLQTYTIPSESMYDTLKVGDFLILNRLAYKFSEPERGDVVVFEYPLDPGKDFIKRVIGTPGDKIKLVDKVVYVNGEPQDEPYRKINEQTPLPGAVTTKDNFEEFTVPEGKYFMMGDNRDNSYDSRFWGFVPESKIKGKALLIYWSLETPKYNSAWAKFPLRPLRFLNPEYNRFERFFQLIN